MSRPPAEPTAPPPRGGPYEEQVLRGRLQDAVGSQFQVRDRLGRGGFADVFEAFDPQLKRTVALKALRPELSEIPELQARFRREAESIASLRHPNILPIHAIGEGQGIVYLVLERVEGRSLQEVLEGDESLPVDEAIRILRSTAAALAAAHGAGIVHRDLKPANVMLAGPRREVRLMDFGVARALGERDGDLTGTGLLVGTPSYMSPEQAAGDTVDPRSDLYALGVLGYELVTGSPPFQSDSARALIMKHLTATPEPVRGRRPECPPALARVIERCLEKSPDVRPQTADEIVEALGNLEKAAHPDQLHPDPDGEGGESEDRDTTGGRAFGLRVGLLVGLVAGSIGIELAFTGTVAASLFVTAVCLVILSLLYGEHRRDGRIARAGTEEGGLRSEGGHNGPSEFGRHAGAVRQARMDRAHIVRGLTRLTRQEQERVGLSAATADHLVARVSRQARQLQRLDERIGSERARGESVRGHGSSTSLLEELLASRDQLQVELAESARLLHELRNRMARAGSSASGELGASLNELLRDTNRLMEE